MDCSLPGSSVHGDAPGKNTGICCHDLLQGIFPTQGSTQVSYNAGVFFTIWIIREAQLCSSLVLIFYAKLYAQWGQELGNFFNPLSSVPSTIHPFYKRWIKHLLVNEWVKWMKERIFKERQMSGVRWSPTDATLIDGQVHAGKIHESAWEIVDFSLGVTIFMCNSLIRKKKNNSFDVPIFPQPLFHLYCSSWRKTPQNSYHNLPHFCCSFIPFQWVFCLQHSTGPALITVSNSLFVSNPVPNPSYLGALILFILPSFWKNFLLWSFNFLQTTLFFTLLLDFTPLPKH